MIFGRELQKQFYLRADKINFNHGSFGTVPVEVMNAHYKALLEQESSPEIWFRKTFFQYIDESRQLLAKLVKVPVEELVLVENASYAVNSILKTFPFKATDKVLVFNSAYRMVTDTLRHLKQSVGVETVELPIPYPLQGENELIQLVQAGLELDRFAMCIFSHISSMPTMVEPVQALTALAKTKGCVVLLDGAHAPGALDLDIHSYGADYYTGNCHKWLFCPKGSAFLWVSPQAATVPQPAVISSTGYYDYVGRFAYTGTRDYTPFVTIPAGLQFIESNLGGLESMRVYNRELLQRGSEYLVAQWGTSYLIPMDMCVFMANVILPKIESQEEAVSLQKRLFDEHNVSMVFGSVPHRDGSRQIFFIRVSVQVYIEMKDFEVLAAGVQQIVSL